MSSSFRLSDLEIHRVIEEETPLSDPLEFFPTLTREVLDENRSWLEPKAIDPATGKLRLCIQSYLIRTPHHTILVDTCVGNHKPRPNRPFWNMKTADTWERNLAATGAEPIGVSDCLNFGNPERPQIMWQFEQAIDGIRDACIGFGIPVVQRLGLDPAPGVKALVVVPTRELAVQVYEDIDMLTQNRPTSVVAIYGGKAYEGQIEQLKAGAQIVVGTPGRLIDLAGQRLLSLAEVQEVVLDEADKMLDLGFLADIEKIFSKVPAVRHTHLFSATMPGPIVALARRFMSNPIHIRATDPDEGLTQANIRHLVYRAHSLDKDEVIARILQADGRGKTVIFTRTKRAAQKLVDELGDRGFNAAAVHGDMSQEARERSMAGFKAGKRDVLIATDVAARGIDVPDVARVINYDAPEDRETYVHRIGRTGRAGRTGTGISFVLAEQADEMRRIRVGLGLHGGPPHRGTATDQRANADRPRRRRRRRPSKVTA